MNDNRGIGPDRRGFLQAAGLIGAGLAMSDPLLRANEPIPQLQLTNTGPDKIPRKPFVRTGRRCLWNCRMRILQLKNLKARWGRRQRA